jgi:hypothetical protein
VDSREVSMQELLPHRFGCPLLDIFGVRKLLVFFSLLFLNFVVLGFELRAYTLSHSTSLVFFFYEGFFEIRSQLFGWVGFELPSS